MSPPVRVLHVLGGLGMDGAETWLITLLRRLARDGAGLMDFLLTGGEPQVFDAEEAELGARMHYLRYMRTHLAEFKIRFRRILLNGGYDAVHDHADYASGWHFAIRQKLISIDRSKSYTGA